MELFWETFGKFNEKIVRIIISKKKAAQKIKFLDHSEDHKLA
jgi:hypothetical protein